MAANVDSASKRGRTTTWHPASHAMHDQTMGPLWYNGAGTTMLPPKKPNRGGESRSYSAGSPETISFGLPVEPPDVGAFHAGDVTSTSGSSERSGSGTYPAGMARRPWASSAGTPITTEGSASSRMASSSR